MAESSPGRRRRLERICPEGCSAARASSSGEAGFAMGRSIGQRQHRCAARYQSKRSPGHARSSRMIQNLIQTVNSRKWRWTCGLLAAVMPAQLALATSHTLPPIPKPVPAPAHDLPVAFSKATPTSTKDLKDIQDHVEALATNVSRAV